MFPLLSGDHEASRRIRRKNSIHISLDDVARPLLKIRYEPRNVPGSNGAQEGYYMVVRLYSFRRVPFLARAELPIGGPHRYRSALSDYESLGSTSAATRPAVAREKEIETEPRLPRTPESSNQALQPTAPTGLCLRCRFSLV